MVSLTWFRTLTWCSLLATGLTVSNPAHAAPSSLAHAPDHDDAHEPLAYEGSATENVDVVFPPDTDSPISDPPPIALPGGNPDHKPVRTVRRIAGETRFETSVNASQAQFAHSANAVVLARSDVVADSVSAGPLAKAVNGPVLLTQPTALHPATAAEIRRLLPRGGKVYLMGGPVAISAQVEREVVKLGVTVERIAGPNRAATATEIARQLVAKRWVSSVFLADGNDWKTSLIAAPTAATLHGVVLVSSGRTLPPETKQFFDDHIGIPVNTVGAAATQAWPSAAHAFTAHTPTELSVALAKHYFPILETLGVATDVDFADALSGGAHIGIADGPLVLIGSSSTEPVEEWLEDNLTLHTIVVYGGRSRVSDELVDDIVDN
ncbi:cell wall-binding repeat-containing protein [Stomatohabitans albus]|uniref:cell wall-binding repeat-containing protein n=1 Tax=Stomatohabitans albus TaxID=3110766 RepID=UPI00300C8884